MKRLHDKIGTLYRRVDEQGYILGCLLPMYLLYPQLPRYRWEEIQKDKYWRNFCFREFKKYLKEVPLEEIKKGDIILFWMPRGAFHLGICAGNDEMFHCWQSGKMELVKMSTYCFHKRLEGVYRWHK